MNYAIIENGVVTNVAVGPDNWKPDGIQAVPATDDCVIGATYDNGVFTPPAPTVPTVTLAETQALKLVELAAACQADIYAGFHSSAIGAGYLYPASEQPPHHDQQNLTASVLASVMPDVDANWTTPFWCADSAGAWAMRAHTAEQIQQVGRDGKARILACMAQNDMLADQVQAATTIEAVNAIVWVSPT